MQDGTKLLALRQPGKKWWRGGEGGKGEERGREGKGVWGPDTPLKGISSVTYPSIQLLLLNTSCSYELMNQLSH